MGSLQLLDEFLKLATTTENWTEAASCAYMQYMHDSIDEVIGRNKNFWQEMKKLG